MTFSIMLSNLLGQISVDSLVPVLRSVLDTSARTVEMALQSDQYS